MSAREQKTVALYARVSTADQNCEMQLDDLRRFGGQRFGRAYEYVDVGVSGTERRRPRLDALLKDVHKCRFDVVLVWKFDRFARSVKHLVDSLEEFRALGINFISYTEGIDTTTPSGELLFHIMGAVAQFERDLIVERCGLESPTHEPSASTSGDPGPRLTPKESLPFAVRASRSAESPRPWPFPSPACGGP